MSQNKIAVVYARYSSHRQGEQSIEGQIAEAYKYAASHGLKIIHEYIDRAMTGRNDNREQFQKMLKDTAKKQFDTIILWKIDRFGRNREEIAFNKYRCKKNGVKVVYVAESIPDSPEGVILESVLEGMAEYYSLQLSQNILRGQRASAEKCQSTGGNRPLGYITDPKTKKFLIDPKTAPTVRKIFSMYAEGKTITEIINDLNSKGLRTLRGGKFTKSSLNSILKNEKYIGVYTYKDQVRIEGGIPAIIDSATFAKVQDMLKINKKAPAHSWSRADYILTDKLFCGHCGSNMIGESGTSKTGSKYNYYICTKRKREHACKKKAVRQDMVEGKVINAIMDMLHNDDILSFIADCVYSCYIKQSHNIDYALSIKRQIQEIDNAQSNILKAIEAGIFNNTTKNRMDELEQQRHDLESELANLKLMENQLLTREYILFYLRDLRNGDTDSIDFKKRIINIFVNSIFVYDDKLTLTFNYSSDTRTISLSELDCINNREEFVYCTDCSTKKAKSAQRDTFCFFRLNGSDGRRTLVPEKQGVNEANGLFRCGLYARIDSRRLHHVGMDSSSIPIFLLKIVISAVMPCHRVYCM